jgi:hypothetical protein
VPMAKLVLVGGGLEFDWITQDSNLRQMLAGATLRILDASGREKAALKLQRPRPEAGRRP